ncbi:aspartyl protease family protein [Lacinutrix jangbogonensis]|uniref:aspartyl protease family protein n=1 Tax=Lacinutrix jangbogonensis TaxID=1469557 RepID=UPI00053E81F7|nr:aspartyl protease family protein [Lacinutrix jangbogonensis]
MKIKKSLLFMLLYLPLICFSQGEYVVKNKRGVDKINFKLLNNVIIIPVEVNGVMLSFLLDSGVSKPIVFNFLKESDSLEILNAETIYLKGLGNNGKVAALKSSGNTFKIGDAVNNSQDFYVIFDSSINFAPKLGVPIHGIIGYDLFKDLVVDINYIKKQIKLTNPEKYKYKTCKKCETFGLEFYNNKPYFNVSVNVLGKNIPVKLLIDSGSSDALWLFENDSLGLIVKDNYFNDFLGYGISGSVHGKRSKIEAFKLKSFILNRPLVAFPDSSYTSVLRQIKDRRGSVGGAILKRFNITIDYDKARIVLKRNSNFKNHFSYNKSGIEVENEGIRIITEYEQNTVSNNMSRDTNIINVQAVFVNSRKYMIKKAYTISYIRPNSPASRKGLQKGDVIIRINGNDTIKYSLQELIYKFYGKEGDKINLVVERLGRRIKVVFNLESLIK